jgi:hypothetical protein
MDETAKPWMKRLDVRMPSVRTSIYAATVLHTAFGRNEIRMIRLSYCCPVGWFKNQTIK